MLLLNGKIVNVRRFPNNETTIDLKQDAIKEQNELVWKYESDEDFMTLLQLESMITFQNPHRRVTCNVLYLPYSRMDRIQDNNPFSLYVLYHMLPSSFDYIFNELHSDVILSLHGKINRLKSVTVNYLTPELLNNCVNQTRLWLSGEPMVLILPDNGAYKRYIEQNVLSQDDLKYFDKIIYCEKDRNFSDGEIKGLKFQDPDVDLTGHAAIILDDLSSFGNTFIRTSKLARAQGARTVQLVIAHGEDSVFKGDLLDHIDALYMTNSITNLTNKSHEKVYIKTLC